MDSSESNQYITFRMNPRPVFDTLFLKLIFVSVLDMFLSNCISSLIYVEARRKDSFGYDFEY